MYPVALLAQDGNDTLSVVDMDELIITESRYESMRSQSTGAISVLKSTTISQLAGVQNLGGNVTAYAWLCNTAVGWDRV